MNAATNPLLRPLGAGWRGIKDFFGYGTDGSYLWPRWLVLRAVGLVYVIIFTGIIGEGSALVGPKGIAPMAGLVAQLRESHDSLLVAVIKAPTLFWLNASPAMVTTVQWLGLAAAVALVLNLWPRITLFVCWLSLLSFARGWIVFSEPQVDWLMLEVALLCIPFAPAGLRPGLGEKSPPWPIAVLMVRWLLFRVMLESGLAKLMSGDAHWRDFTALDILYETAPCPTFFGYIDHQLPHLWHVGEWILTFAAEIAAPLAAVFLGRRGRWFAFWAWLALQAGIQATCNFGWLNTASIGLGLLLFDDQMLAGAARRLRLARLGNFLAERAARQVAPPRAPAWRRCALGTALWIHFYLSIIVFWDVTQYPRPAVLDWVAKPLKFAFDGLGSVNAFKLYSRFDPFHCVAEFVGSNDGGQTWRPYEFRYFPQRLDRIPPWIAPRFPRFEATLQILVATRSEPSALYGVVAGHLLNANPEVLRLFVENPFPDRPPQMIRMPGYQYKFTDWATYRKTGHFWTREYLGEYMPMMYVSPKGGEITQTFSELEQVQVKAHYGNPEAQAYLGYLHLNGAEGAEQNHPEAARWLRLAADQGHPTAQFQLALMLSEGVGVPRNPTEAAHWCRRAAALGLPPAQDRLGVMHIQGEGVARDEAEALAWFEAAARAGLEEAAGHRDYVRSRASAATIMRAEQRVREIEAQIAQGKSNRGR